MNLKQYLERQQAVYDGFAKAIKRVVEVILRADASIVGPQQIQTRAKSKTSLTRKLKDNNLLQSRTIEKHMKDLAGVRLIFYTNTDIDRFLNSGLLRDNFHIDYDASKIHEPSKVVSDANEQYRGIHYVVGFKADRLALPEYAAHKGLRCEIQIQTILNHAWSETAHDIVYHRDETAGFGAKQLEQINRRMNAIMEKYLLPAGYEFQKVQYDFQRLREGRALLDNDAIAALDACQDNNERADLLQKIIDDVLPQIDDPASIAHGLRDAAVRAIQSTRATEPTPVKTILGDYAGYSKTASIKSALNIIRFFRYSDIVGTFKILRSLYPGAQSADERKLILEAIDDLAKPKIPIWKQAGSYVQDVLVTTLSRMKAPARQQNRVVVLRGCSGILTSEMSGTTETAYDTVTFTTGAVVPTRKLGKIRKEALKIILALHKTGTTQEEQMESFAALQPAIALPNIARYGDDLWVLVLQSAMTIVKFLTDRISEQPYALLSSFEHHCQIFHAQHLGVRATVPPVSAAVVTAYQGLELAIAAFRQKLNAKPTYQKYKMLVGYHPVFDESFGPTPPNFSQLRAIREQRVDKYVRDLSKAKEKGWLKLVQDFEKQADSAYGLAQFLRKVGAQKPLIALRWLAVSGFTNQHFRAALLDGVLSGGERSKAERLMGKWAATGKNLLSMAYAMRDDNNFDAGLFRTAFSKALKADDQPALSELVGLFFSKMQQLKSADTNALLLPGIEQLDAAGSWQWIVQIWGDEAGPKKLLMGLTKTQAVRILKCLISIPDIDFHAESLLVPIATRFPAEVLELFKSRIERDLERPEGRRFQAIPFSLDELPKAFVGQEGVAATAIRAWYSPDDHLFRFTGGGLLAKLSPQFAPDLADALQRIVRNDLSDVNFVLAVLDNYKGETATHETFKVVVNALPEGDKRLGAVEISLMATDVAHGDFGLVELYTAKKVEIQPWLSDPRAKVKAFAKRYNRSLDRTIAAEQRRAQADLEMRKHQFDSNNE
ncbi:RelA/SpoT domain-containing protein [Bradyrhizobium sp. Arg62]|uniref:GTP pyrophosphokinase n=1 Tax=Bradyrhizobium brasilense TaxID=1419277 RepID=UPI001E288871|nr:RelA/SpoT domain-containing protein [Bradyrhizobium brasilense]MCC8948206.1 RelA/SpoT domain-containing protein [Bradyrhizobium brasilense]